MTLAKRNDLVRRVKLGDIALGLLCATYPDEQWFVSQTFHLDISKSISL